MKPLLLAAVLALPIAGLAVGIAAREAALSDASEWRIPVTGYDPRDPIRGHYIRFVYDWRVGGNPAHCAVGAACDVCLSRDADIVAATIRKPGADCNDRVDTAASGINIMLPGADSAAPQFASRIFVSETSAPTLDAALRDQPMVVVARLTSGGRLVNQRLEPAQSNQPRARR